jgi:hypothetical protein
VDQAKPLAEAIQAKLDAGCRLLRALHVDEPTESKVCIFQWVAPQMFYVGVTPGSGEAAQEESETEVPRVQLGAVAQIRTELPGSRGSARPVH